MYRQLRQRPGNLFFSPFSIRTTLGMTYAGARGETAAQMRETLRLSSPEEAPHVAFAEIVERLMQVAAASTRWPWRTRSGARMVRRSSRDSWI